jgi:DNA-binding response OmpR family regulator
MVELGGGTVHVLVAEDEPRLLRLIARVLRESGHVVETVSDGVDALEMGLEGGYEAIVLDVMMPALDGFEVARRLRAARIRTPILMLTARDAIEDRVRGLDAGADDYLVKPFAFEELLARLRALGRRATEGAEGTILRAGDLSLDLVRHEARRGDRLIELTPKEFALLEYLMRNAGRVLTRTQLLDHVWGYDAETSSNVVDIYIHYLRNKVEGEGKPGLIRTVRGVGYSVRE